MDENARKLLFILSEYSKNNNILGSLVFVFERLGTGEFKFKIDGEKEKGLYDEILSLATIDDQTLVLNAFCNLEEAMCIECDITSVLGGGKLISEVKLTDLGNDFL